MTTRNSEWRAPILAEHYQKTFEVTYESWKSRNRLFFYLLILVSISSVLTFHVPQAESLLVHFVGKLAGMDSSEALRDQFPFDVVNAALVVAVFYVLVNMYQQASIVSQNDVYLRALETELRQELELGTSAMFFQREKKFNSGEHRPAAIIVGWTYALPLGVLLSIFIGGRIVDDVARSNWWLGALDVCISIMLLYYYGLYLRGVIDTEKRRTQGSG